MLRNSVVIYDTTLRDGEQAPGFAMNPEEKLRMGKTLEQLGVDMLEVGFPASSADDAIASRRLAEEIRDARISVLARARRDDIDLCVEALQPVADGRIHVFIATSDLHIREKLKSNREENLENARLAIRYARNRCGDVQFGCEDATRADPEYLFKIIEACIAEGASTIDVADTVGYTTPWEFESLIASIANHVAGVDKVDIAVHCHDDLGLAVANSIAGVRAGARQVECTINGIGERAGNASLEEIVMILKTRRSLLGLETRVRSQFLNHASQTLTDITGIPVQPNKAIVGSNAFSHEAGIHQHGLIANSLTYELVSPAAVGASGRKFILGKHSGRSAIRQRLQDLSLNVTEDRFDEFMTAFKQFASSHTVEDADLINLVQGVNRKVAYSGSR